MLLNYSLKNLKLGNHLIEASIFSNKENIIKQTTIKIFADSPPILYTYEIINEYPHDQEAYTQGLEFYNDTLYESTGLKGKSTIRKLNYKTGEIYSIQPLDPVYFGEGLTLINEKLIQLTWREGIGFQYNPITLEIERSFSYDKSKEGWGLCNDGVKIYKSDGTNFLWILDSKTQKEIDLLKYCKGKTFPKNWVHVHSILMLDKIPRYLAAHYYCLILGAWHFSSTEDKIKRFHRQISYGCRRGETIYNNLNNYKGILFYPNDRV